MRRQQAIARRCAAKCATLFIACAAAGVQADTRRSLTLLVANRSSHEVTLVDIDRGDVSGRVATGEGPHLLSNVVDGRLLATGYGEFPRPHAGPVASRPPFVETLNSRVSLIDINEQLAVWDTVLDDCSKPHASWIVGHRGFVTCEPEEVVQEIDLRDGSALRRTPTRQSGAHVLSYEPASRSLGVSNVASGSITLIDTDKGSTRVVELAPGSEGAIAYRAQIWVANSADGSVSVVDPVDAIEVARIESVCNFPVAFAHNTGHRLWIACFGSAELVAIDTDRARVSRRISLPANPLNVLLHPVRSIAYVSYPRKNAIGEIDLASGKELRRLSVGIEPDGLRWATMPRP